MRKIKIYMVLVIFLVNAVGMSTISAMRIEQKNDNDTEPTFENFNEVYINGDPFPTTTTFGSSDVFCFPTDDAPLTIFGFEEYNKDWDEERGAWRYRFRYDWYQAKRKEPWDDGTGFDKWPYVVLEVDLSITESNTVPNSANDFAHGGWNVHESSGSSYPYKDLAAGLCNLVIASFPYVGLAFSTGLSLAQSYKDAPPQPEYTWLGQQVKEGSGFFQFDCYAYPDQKIETWVQIDVWGSSIDRMYQDYGLRWHHTRNAPSKNAAPDKPSAPSGQSQGEAGVSYSYSGTIYDPNDDDVYIQFDWGDGDTSGWYGPYASGTKITQSHTWYEQGDYSIRVRGKDTWDAVGSWSSSKHVSMPKTKTKQNILLSTRFMDTLSIIQRFSKTFKGL